MYKLSKVALDKLLKAKRVIAITGAGISKASGIPTFRGDDSSFWAKYKPEQLASLKSFLNNPEFVWQWYFYRRQQIEKFRPNLAHIYLAKLEEFFDTFVIITQNVDNFHKVAGSKDVIEIHGNIFRVRCLDCNEAYYMSNSEIAESGLPPKCKKCGGILRPDVVWFGELLPEDLLSRSLNLLEDVDIVFVIGTSGVVYPVNYFPEIAKQRGAYIIEVNTNYTPISNIANEVLKGKAEDIIPLIYKQMKGLI